eukprot:s1253_g24.t2
MWQAFWPDEAKAEAAAATTVASDLKEILEQEFCMLRKELLADLGGVLKQHLVDCSWGASGDPAVSHGEHRQDSEPGGRKLKDASMDDGLHLQAAAAHASADSTVKVHSYFRKDDEVESDAFAITIVKRFLWRMSLRMRI